jgi:hypothetical protein
MSAERNGLRELALRVNRGDSAAAAEFVQIVEPQVVRMVRRAVRTGNSASALARRIIAETVHLMFREAGPAVDQDALIAEITRRICRSAADGLRPGWHDERNCLETVPDAGSIGSSLSRTPN